MRYRIKLHRNLTSSYQDIYGTIYNLKNTKISIRSETEFKCHGNVITSRLQRNTYAYQVRTSISGRHFSSFCTDRQTDTDRRTDVTKNNTCTHFAEHSWQAGNNLALSVSVNYESGLCKLANGSDSRHVSNALAFRFKISAVSAARVHHFYVSESASMQIHPRSPRHTSVRGSAPSR